MMRALCFLPAARYNPNAHPLLSSTSTPHIYVCAAYIHLRPGYQWHIIIFPYVNNLIHNYEEIFMPHTHRQRHRMYGHCMSFQMLNPDTISCHINQPYEIFAQRHVPFMGRSIN